MNRQTITHVLALLSLPALTQAAPTILIDYDDDVPGNGVHESAVRNGGFETSAINDSYSVTPDWNSYFAEGNTDIAIYGTTPHTGSKRGSVSGFSGAGNRVHASQTFEFADWTIEEGDTFEFGAWFRQGTGADLGADDLQFIIHVINAAGNAVNDPANSESNNDRLLSRNIDLSTAATWLRAEEFSQPVPAGSPWIGQRIQMRILNVGARAEFLMIDDVWLIGHRATPPGPATLIANYEAELDTLDSSGSALHGTPAGSLTYDSGFGEGRSFAFNGSDASISVPNSAPGDFSISFWMRTDQAGSTGDNLAWWNGNGLVDGAVAGAANDFGISLNGHQIAFGVGDAVATEYTLFSQSFVTDDRWHHIVATRQSLGGAIDLWIDGILEASGTGPSGDRSAAPNLRFGSRQSGGGFFGGNLDKVRLYTGLLTPAEIAALRVTPGDSDGDGQDDASEAVAGTDWGDATNYFRVARAEEEGGAARVIVDGRAGRLYRLWRADLAGGLSWNEVAASEVLYDDGELALLDPAPLAGSPLYRVTAEQGTPKRPNIVVLLIDDMGYADVGAYAHSAADTWTPNLDRIANAGTRFTNAYVSGCVCSPTRAGWNTGRHQSEWNKGSGWSPGLPSNVQTLAEMLQEEGYATCKIGKNDYGTHLGQYDNFAQRDYPGNHGYDRFFGFNAHGHSFWYNTVAPAGSGANGTSGHAGPLQNHNFLAVPSVGPTTTPFAGTDDPDNSAGDPDYYLTKLFVDQGIKFVQDAANEADPFFLAVTFNAVHNITAEVSQDYLDQVGTRLGVTMPSELERWDPATNTTTNPASFTTFYSRYQEVGNIVGTTDLEKGQNMRKYYLANLLALDENIGRLLDELDTQGVADETIIIAFSDNGGPPENGADNGPLMGSKYTLFEGGIRVPFIVSWPGMLPEGQVRDDLISSLDLVPTCLEAARAERRPNLRGFSLLDPLRTGDPVFPGERTLFWKWQSGNFAVRKGDWKLIDSAGSGRLATPGIYFDNTITNKLSLFDVATNPSEITANDKVGSEIAIRDSLQTLWTTWHDGL